MSDSVKIMQLRNVLAVAKRAHYDGQKQTKLSSFFKHNWHYMYIHIGAKWMTATGVTMWEETALFHVYRAFFSVLRVSHYNVVWATVPDYRIITRVQCILINAVIILHVVIYPSNKYLQITTSLEMIKQR